MSSHKDSDFGIRSSQSPIRKTRQSERAPFEVEIHTGNRAGSAQPRAGDGGFTPTEAGSRLALRRARVARRGLLLQAGLLTLALGLIVWSTAKAWQPWFTGDVVARVNGRAITYQQVEKEVRLSKALSSLGPVAATGGKVQAPSLPAMLEQLILLELKVQAAQQANFTVSRQEVEAGIAWVVQQAGITQGKLDESLAANGLTRDDLYASVARITLARRFAESGVAGDMPDPKEKLLKINAWQADLVQKAQIERVREPNSGVGPRVGMEAPDFTLKQLDGKEVSLSASRGTMVIVYVWAPWCPACRAEAPVLEQAYRAQASGQRFEILAIATQSDAPNVASFVQELGMTFPVLVDSQSEVADLYQAWTIPTAFFVDKAGIIRAIQAGQMDAATLAQTLRAAGNR